MLVVDLRHPRRQRGRPILSFTIPSHGGPISRNGPHRRRWLRCRPIAAGGGNVGRNWRRHAAGQLSISDWGRRRRRSRCHGTGDQSTSVGLVELLVVVVLMMVMVVVIVLAVVVLLLERR